MEGVGRCGQIGENEMFSLKSPAAPMVDTRIRYVPAPTSCDRQDWGAPQRASNPSQLWLHASMKPNPKGSANNVRVVSVAPTPGIDGQVSIMRVPASEATKENQTSASESSSQP